MRYLQFTFGETAVPAELLAFPGIAALSKTC